MVRETPNVWELGTSSGKKAYYIAVVARCPVQFNDQLKSFLLIVKSQNKNTFY